MNYVSTRRAIVIALLFILLPVVFAADRSPVEQGSTGSSITEAQTSKPVMVEISATASSDLDANPNKGKLTIFFAIGLVINLVLMTLFGLWAIRQWRKSDKRGQAS